MAVHDRSYHPYEGALTPGWSRFLVLPRYALRDLFSSKIALTMFIAAFVWPLISAALIYLHHNVGALALLDLPVAQLIVINPRFFYIFMSVQTWFCIFLTLLVGPTLISADYRNNALPLYFARPFSRGEYVL